jgi:L-ascorbate metabolism protein UlaG (beta-lactamase superfamily)
VIGFVFRFADAPENCVYFSGDTVWYEGVAEVAERFPVQVAILNLGGACVTAVGPFHLTMTAAAGAEAARALREAQILPLHFEGWEHFAEGREEITRVFAKTGLTHRLHWPEPGRVVSVAV